MSDAVAGWDVGGAHVKLAVVHGSRLIQAEQVPCPLWNGVQELDRAIAAALARLPSPVKRHAVSMTAELCDAFPDRGTGVRAIVAALGKAVGCDGLRFFAGLHGWVTAREVTGREDEIASANWLATAELVRVRVGGGLLVDVGSTTMDMIPLGEDGPLVSGFSDAERLAGDELIYQGIVRTPLMAIAQRAPFAGQWQDLANECFATTADVYRLTGELPAEWDQHGTADGRGRSASESAARLARLFGRDLSDAPLAGWRVAAGFFRERQLDRLGLALARHQSRAQGNIERLIGAGSGRFLVADLAERHKLDYIDFADLVSDTTLAAAVVAGCAPAVSLALLLSAGLDRSPVGHGAQGIDSMESRNLRSGGR
jgi:probable H4MPT-linked C1 transfer pathway protein